MMRVRLTLVLLLSQFSTIGMACESDGSPWLDLRISAGELADSAEQQVVQVFDDGCVRLRRPEYFIDPGWYTLSLAAADMRQLANLAAQPALRTFDAAALDAEVARAQAQRAGQDGPGELFAVMGADRYDLAIREGGTETKLTIDAVFQLRERYPQIGALSSVAKLIASLQEVAGRSERQPLQVSP